MIAYPWKTFVEKRKQARKVYQDTVKASRDAFTELSKEANRVYTETVEEARLEYKEASL